MKKTMFPLLLLVIGTTCLADSPIVADLKELYKVMWEKKPDSISLQEHWDRLDEMKSRVRPIVSLELAKLAEGEVTPLVRDLLQDSEIMDFCWGVLDDQFKTYSVDAQIKGLNAMFNAAPDSQRGCIIRLFMLDLPQEVFAGGEVQKWLVDKINGGMPAGAYYFILTDESAKAVSKTATTSMKQFSKAREDRDENLFSLVSTVFLASCGDDAAVKLLDSLLEKRNINSLFDTGYVIPAAAMSGNEKLIQKIRDIITKDKRSLWNGEDCMPKETSFAHIAASACSLVIEGFPSVEYWENYDETMKKKVHDWLKANPTHKIKPNPRMLFEETSFQGIITAMSRYGEK